MLEEEKKSRKSAEDENKNIELWNKIFRKNQIELNPEYAEKVARRGIPNKVRWEAWKRFTKLEEYTQSVLNSLNQSVLNKMGLESNPTSTEYFKYCKSSTTTFEHLIGVDLARTFPEIESFDSVQQEKLRHVLCGYAVHNPDCGYCQGLNFLAGLIIIVSNGDTEKAFYFLIYMLDELSIQGFFRVGFPRLTLTSDIIMAHLQEQAADLAEHFKTQDLQPALYLHQWLLSLFINCLPQPTVLVIWDSIIATKRVALIVEICVALLVVLKPMLMRLNFEGVIYFLRTMRREDDNCDPPLIGKLLIRKALKYPLPEEYCEKLKWYPDGEAPSEWILPSIGKLIETLGVPLGDA